MLFDKGYQIQLSGRKDTFTANDVRLVIATQTKAQPLLHAVQKLTQNE